MQHVPHYLEGKVISDITSYEVSHASINGAFKFTNKALSGEELDAAGIEQGAAGKWYVVKMAGSEVDRHRERFTLEVLQKYAEDINRNGSTFNFGHTSDNLIGKVTKASVMGGDLVGYVWVDDLAVMPNQHKMSVNHAIEVGIIKEVSVEVSGLLRSSAKNEDGFATEWEYFFDPSRPEATEFHGLALVKRGAQRGAALSVKALDGKTEPTPQQASKTIRDMKEVFIVNGQKHALTAKAEGNEIVFDAESVKALEVAIAAVEKEAVKTTELTNQLSAKSAEIEALRAPFEADIINGEKALELPETDRMTIEAVKGLTTTELISKAKAVTDKVASKSVVEPITMSTKLPWQA